MRRRLICTLLLAAVLVSVCAAGVAAYEGWISADGGWYDSQGYYYGETPGVTYTTNFNGKDLYPRNAGGFTLYSEPRKSAYDLDHVSAGNKVSCAGETRDAGGKLWYKVFTYRHNFAYAAAWVSEDDAVAVDAGSPAPALGGTTAQSTPFQSVTSTLYLGSGAVQMRRESSFSSTAVVTVPQGSTMTSDGYLVDGVGKIWYRVYWNNLTGWVCYDVSLMTVNSFASGLPQQPSQPAVTQAPLSPEAYGYVQDSAGVYYSQVYRGQTLFVIGNVAYAYLTPSSSATPVSSFSAGQTVLCAGETWENGNILWYRYEWTDGSNVVRSGWVPASQLRLASQAQQPAAPAAAVLTQQTAAGTGRTLVEIRTHAVFVRNRPRGEEFGTANYWQRYLYLGQQTDDRGKVWYQIQYGDRVGFVTSEYCVILYESPDGSVSETNPAAPPPAAPPAAGTGRTLVEVRSHAVYVRSGPGLDHTALGTVHHWERYLYLGEQADSRPVTWYKIQWGTTEGWVSSVYTAVIQE